MEAALKAFFGYLFLVFIVRVVGRRPGSQYTPFEMVLVFVIGGLALTAMVGDELSFRNAICQIVAIALAHHVVKWLRAKSRRIAHLFDGTPLVLLERAAWRGETLRGMRVIDDDVMQAARERGLEALNEIDRAILERNGAISIVKFGGD